MFCHQSVRKLQRISQTPCCFTVVIDTCEQCGRGVFTVSVCDATLIALVVWYKLYHWNAVAEEWVNGPQRVVRTMHLCQEFLDIYAYVLNGAHTEMMHPFSLLIKCWSLMLSECDLFHTTFVIIRHESPLKFLHSINFPFLCHLLVYTNPVYRVTVPEDNPASSIPGMTECTANSFLEPGLRKVWIFTGPANSVLTFQVGRE